MSAAKPTLAETIAAITQKVTIARSVVSVTAQALYHGQTDLEMHAGETLGPAADMLDDVVSELCGLRFDFEESPEGADAEAQP